MNGKYDFVVVGAGHNGLVTAAYLAKRGKRVLALERRPHAGGTVVTEGLAPGFSADAVWAGGMLRPDIVRRLGLSLGPVGPAMPFISLLGNERLEIAADPQKAAEGIRRFSEKDAARWPEFVRFMGGAAAFLAEAYATIMPRLPKEMSWREGLGLAELGLDLRLMGRKNMLNIIRVVPMTALEIVEEWFESEVLRAAIASLAVHSMTLGPMEPGTGLTLLHNWMTRGGLAHRNVGRAGEIPRSLEAAVRRFGGEVRTEAEVERILVDTLRCSGVVLRGGEEIEAGAVLSSLDPKRTFLSLVQAVNLPPEFVWHVQSIKMRGSVSKLHLLTNGSHEIPGGTLVVAPSIRYLEHAYDAAKYGQVSESPYLEITTSGNIVSVHIQYTPYSVREGAWSEQGARLEQLTLAALKVQFPKLEASILDRRMLTPADLETVYGVTEGDLNHGQLMLDQILFMRPLPGWSNHRTPIDNLYLCGSGVHGGGGVSGAAGRNAAEAVLAYGS